MLLQMLTKKFFGNCYTFGFAHINQFIAAMVVAKYEMVGCQIKITIHD